VRLPRLKFNWVLTHTLSALLAVFLFYSIVFVANILGIPFYLGYNGFTVDIVVLTRTVDRVLWVFSILVFSTLGLAGQARKMLNVLRIICLLLYGLVLTASICVFLFGFDVLRTVGLMVSGLAFILVSIFLSGEGLPLILPIFYGMLMLVGVEVASLARWVYHLFSPSPVLAGESWSIAFAEAQISNILYPVLPGILVFFALSWIGEFTFKGLFARRKAEHEDSRLVSGSRSRKASLIVALFSVFAALFIGYYNFAIAGVHNPGFPGTDTAHYIERLNDMLSVGPAGALSIASKDDRFLYLVLQYFGFWFSGSSPEVFVTFSMPLVLTFLLMLSTFFLVRVGRGLFQAVTSMLFTVFSFQVTVGLYAGFYANWFALFFAYVFYGLLMVVFRGRRSLWLLVLTGLASIAVLYVHPWTWILLVMMIPTAYILVTLLLVWIRRIDFRRYVWEIRFLAALLAVNVAMFYIRDFLGIGSGARLVDGYLDVVALNPSILNTFKLYYFLVRTFNAYVGGFYAYVPVIVLAILGVLSFLDYEDRYDRLLLTWMLIASAMISVDFPWHARFLYVTPFNIYVALGVLYGAEQFFRFADSQRLRCMAPLVFWVFYILSILLLLNYAVRCVAVKQFGYQGLTVTP